MAEEDKLRFISIYGYSRGVRAGRKFNIQTSRGRWMGRTEEAKREWINSDKCRHVNIFMNSLKG